MPHRPATCVNSDARHWVAGPIECGGRVSGRIPDVRRDTPRTFIARTVRDEAEVIYTDDLKSYLGIGDHDTHHETVHHAAQEWGIGDVHTTRLKACGAIARVAEERARPDVPHYQRVRWDAPRGPARRPGRIHCPVLDRPAHRAHPCAQCVLRFSGCGFHVIRSHTRMAGIG